MWQPEPHQRDPARRARRGPREPGADLARLLLTFAALMLVDGRGGLGRSRRSAASSRRATASPQTLVGALMTAVVDLPAGAGDDPRRRAARRAAAGGGRDHRRQHLRHAVPDLSDVAYRDGSLYHAVTRDGPVLARRRPADDRRADCRA